MIRLILIGIISLISTQIFSQQSTCSPDSTLADTSFVLFPLPTSEANPDGGITDSACLNKPFSFVLNFRVPNEVTISGLTVALDTIFIETEGAIGGLPLGMGYACNPPTCAFAADSLISGCLILYGVPEEKGDFSLSITTNLLTNLGPFGPFTLPSDAVAGAEGEYVLTVLDEDSGDCFVDMTSSASDVLSNYLSLDNVPNPFQDYTLVRINSTINDQLNFEVFDLVGRRVYNEKIRVFEGANYVEFDGSTLNEGIYIYTLRNKDGWMSKKMIINR